MTARTARAAQAVPAGRPETLYFAYGSNLHLAQMAKRCPESRYIGRGELNNYRWHINQRGYANVVPDQRDKVAGLCYLLSANDEARLDRNEGVPTAYEKEYRHVLLLTANASLVGRKVTEIHASGALDVLAESRVRSDSRRLSSADPMVRNSSPSDQDLRNKGQYVEALVYLSRTFTEDSNPREEYIHRMNSGIADAIALGMSEDFVNNRMRPFIPADYPRSQEVRKRAPQHHREEPPSADESEAGGPTDRRLIHKQPNPETRDGYDNRQPATGREMPERHGSGGPRDGVNGPYRRGELDPRNREPFQSGTNSGVSQARASSDELSNSQEPL